MSYAEGVGLMNMEANCFKVYVQVRKRLKTD